MFLCSVCSKYYNIRSDVLYIYGLDLSMSSTGVAVYDTEKEEFVHISSIDTTKILAKNHKDNFDGVRLKKIYDELCAIRDRYEPSFVAIERGFTLHNTVTQILYRVHGVANLAFADYPQIYYTPKAIKSTIYDGTADKEEIANVVEKRTNAEFSNFDESDACSIALTYAIKEGIIEWDNVIGLTRKQLLKQGKVKKGKLKDL